MATKKGTQRRKERRERIVRNEERRRIRHKSKKYLDIIKRNDALKLLRDELSDSHIELSSLRHYYIHKQYRQNEYFISVSMTPIWRQVGTQMTIGISKTLFKKLSQKHSPQNDQYSLLKRDIFDTVYVYLQSRLIGDALAEFRGLAFGEQNYTVNIL